MLINVLLIRGMIELYWANLSIKILLNNSQLCIEPIFQIFYFIFTDFDDLIKHF